jgi:hypothetical protein
MLEIFLQFRYLFSFLSLLVKHQWFWEIIIIYLPVGHTHEKVDRDLFATIGNLKSLKDCQIPDQILDLTWLGFEGSLNQGMPISLLFII